MLACRNADVFATRRGRHGRRRMSGVGMIERHHKRLPASGVQDELCEETLDPTRGGGKIRSGDKDPGPGHNAVVPRCASSQQPKTSTDHNRRAWSARPLRC